MWHMARIKSVLTTALLLLIGIGLGHVLEVQASGLIQSAYNLIQNGGSNLTRRQTLNFTGAGVTCADATTKTTCTVSGGGSGSPNYSQTFTTQTSVTLTHNLNSTAVVVQCFNSAMPPVNIDWDTLTLTDANNATVTFLSSQSGTCVVSGGPGLGTTRQWFCSNPGLGDGTNAITAATYLQTNCYNSTGATVTVTGVKCFTDNSGTSTMDVANGASTSLLTGAVTCTSAFAAGSQSATTTIVNGDFLKFTFVADGTSKQWSGVVLGTY